MIVYTTSLSFERHVRRCLEGSEDVIFARSEKGLPAAREPAAELIVVHAPGQPTGLSDGLLKRLVARPAVVGVAADVPTLAEFLRVSGMGARAYFNSYMADIHYAQMLAMVRGGQSWVVPDILDQALAIARTSQLSADDLTALSELTPRQRQVAMDVVEGLSNREIAEQLGIAEPTVKVHLGNIFKKLDVKSRFELAVKLQGLREAS